MCTLRSPHSAHSPIAIIKQWEGGKALLSRQVLVSIDREREREPANPTRRVEVAARLACIVSLVCVSFARVDQPAALSPLARRSVRFDRIRRPNGRWRTSRAPDDVLESSNCAPREPQRDRATRSGDTERHTVRPQKRAPAAIELHCSRARAGTQQRAARRLLHLRLRRLSWPLDDLLAGQAFTLRICPAGPARFSTISCSRVLRTQQSALKVVS